MCESQATVKRSEDAIVIDLIRPGMQVYGIV